MTRAIYNKTLKNVVNPINTQPRTINNVNNE